MARKRRPSMPDGPERTVMVASAMLQVAVDSAGGRAKVAKATGLHPGVLRDLIKDPTAMTVFQFGDVVFECGFRVRFELERIESARDAQREEGK